MTDCNLYFIYFSGSAKSRSKTKKNSNSLERKTSLKTSASNVDKTISSNLKSFTFNDLREATKNFRQENLIGEGGFGFVYKGWMDENTFAPTRPGTGIVVAIKKLKPESFQGHREWLVCLSQRKLLNHFLTSWFCQVLTDFLHFLFAGRSQLSKPASP